MRRDSSATFSIGQVVLIFVLFTTAVSSCILESDSSPETIVMVEPSSSSVTIGDTFSINVTVVDVQNLYGLEMTLNWNSTILRLVNIELRLEQDGGVLYSPTYIAENLTQGNSYTLSAASTNPASSFNGTGNIASMTFSVVGAGSCVLSLQTLLYDYPPLDRDHRFSLPIAHTDSDGLVQCVIPEFPHFLVVVATIALTLFSTVLCKHISNSPTRRPIDPCKLVICDE